MNERTYHRQLVERIEELFPNCVVLRNDPIRTPGIPDILILYGNTWAMLEIKAADDSSRQPNQDYYVELFDNMSFASFINPDNEEEVLNALQSTFGSPR